MFVFEGLKNFRDVGGLPTADGSLVKTGTLFRSASLDTLTARDARRLAELGVRVVCDLRKPDEARKAAEDRVNANGVRRVNFPLHWQASHESRRYLRKVLFAVNGEQQYERYIAEYYRHIAFAAAPRIGEVVRLLADPAGSPMVVYCSAGKDRTGIVIAVVLTLLGVGFEDVTEDYVRTNLGYSREIARLTRWVPVVSLFRVPRPRVELVVGTHARFLRAVFDEVIQRHGSFENYVISACGVPAATLDALRRQLIVSK
jgi:protein-tyrosine phosphatase